MSERRKIYKVRFGREMRGERRAWVIALALLAVVIIAEALI